MAPLNMTVDGIRKWRWQFAVSRLRSAYDAARSSIDAELRQVAIAWEEFQHTDAPDPHDLAGVDAHDAHGDHLSDRDQEGRDALVAIKQGFAVILYHSWERHTTEWTDWTGKYRHPAVVNQLKLKGYIVDKGIDKLNKIANCIKHNSAELWKQKEHRHMFDPAVEEMVSDEVKPDYARYLNLSDKDMDELFKAMRESGPPEKARASL